MSERDPLDNLRDLIDQPVAPRAAFADELRSRLMREMSASEGSREEQPSPMDAVTAPRPPLAFPTERTLRIRPMLILELAAVAVVILGLAAALSRGWFGGGDPGQPSVVPAAVLPDNGTPTVVPETSATATPVPTIPLEPTIVPPNGALWSIALPEGESLDFGGMLVEDGVVYRLLATTSFVGIEAVDGETGAMLWKNALPWNGSLFAIEDDLIFYSSEPNVLSAVDAETGDARWSAVLDGNPLEIDTEDDLVLTLLDTGSVAAVRENDGEVVWTTAIDDGSVAVADEAGQSPSGRIRATDSVVAAISAGGTIAGFDIATGELKWSLDGYDGARTTLQEENDVLVITTGGPAFAGEAGVMTSSVSETTGSMSSSAAVLEPGASPAPGESGMSTGGGTSGSSDAGASHGGTTGSEMADPAAPLTCTEIFTAPAHQAGTVESGASVGGAVGVTSVTSAETAGIQGIDPETGALLWEHSSTGAFAVASTDRFSVQAGSAGCAVDVRNGAIVTLPAPGNAAPEAGVSAVEDGQVVVGAITSSGFVPAQGGVEFDGPGVSLSASGEFIAIASDESGVYGTMLDGTLVKIASGTNDSDAADD